MTRTGSKPTQRRWISDDPPSRRLLWWVRGIIIMLWIASIVADGPGLLERARSVYASIPPGAARRAALEPILQDAVLFLFCLPMLLLAILGFGVFPRKATDVWATGGPWFVPMWKTPPARAGASASRKQHKQNK